MPILFGLPVQATNYDLEQAVGLFFATHGEAAGSASGAAHSHPSAPMDTGYDTSINADYKIFFLGTCIHECWLIRNYSVPEACQYS